MRGDYRPTYRPLAIHRNASMAPIGDQRHDPSLQAKAGESARGTARRVERNADKRVRYDGDQEMRAAARERARRYHARRKAAQAAETIEAKARRQAAAIERARPRREALEGLLAEMDATIAAATNARIGGSAADPEMIIEW